MDGPTEKARDLHTPFRGTLRDTFAAAALPGILIVLYRHEDQDRGLATCAKIAYKLADAMIEASSDRSGRSD